MKSIYSKIVCIALFAALLISSTAIGFSSQKSARRNVSALSMGNVEAMSSGETFNDVLIGVGLMIFSKGLDWAGNEILEMLSDDGILYCRLHTNDTFYDDEGVEHPGHCLPGHKISLRHGCGKYPKPNDGAQFASEGFELCESYHNR